MTNELINTNLPSFLAPIEKGKVAKGLETAQEYTSLTYVKVVQQMTKAPVKPPASDGDLVAMPDNVIFLKHQEVMHFVPIFMYQEYCIHNPLNAKGLDFIRDRSFDKKSEIAFKARSRNRADREFPCPEAPEKKCQYTEHLNFVIYPLDHTEAIGKKPLIISFFKGNWKYGNNFIQLLKARQVDCICANQFALSTSLRPGKEGDWYGIDVHQPIDVPVYVQDEQLYNACFKLHTELEEEFKASGVRFTYEEEPETVDPDATGF